MPIVVKLLLGVAGVYAFLVWGTSFLQRRLMYFPSLERVDPAAIGLSGVRELEIVSADGAQVLAWYGKAAPGRPTLLYFHGNGGSLSFRSERIRRYVERGYGVFMMTYRGYGGSTGQPSERANVADAKLAYDRLRQDGVEAKDIVLYGESLGSGVAVQVGADRSVGGIVLDAPYTSVVDVAAGLYPFLPTKTMMTDRYESSRFIGQIKAPLLIVHGVQDSVIPVEMGKELFALAPEPKEIALFARAGHSDHHLHGSYDAVFGWLERRWPQAGQAQESSARRA